MRRVNEGDVMCKTKVKYNDFITGEERVIVFPRNPLSKNERWLESGDYRHKTDERCCDNCRHSRYLFSRLKCEQVGVDESSASDIDKDCVCNFWDTKEDKRRKEYKEKL